MHAGITAITELAVESGLTNRLPPDNAKQSFLLALSPLPKRRQFGFPRARKRESQHCVSGSENGIMGRLFSGQVKRGQDSKKTDGSGCASLKGKPLHASISLGLILSHPAHQNACGALEVCSKRHFRIDMCTGNCDNTVER